MLRTTPLRARQLASLITAATLVTGLAACGGDDDAAPTTPPTTTVPATVAPSTSAAGTAAPTTEPATPSTAAGTTEPAATTDPAAAPTTGGVSGGVTDVPADAAVDPWTRDASEFASDVGSSFRYACPPTDVDPADADTIWGVELYTDDSSVCWAAVHVGLITPTDGGEVVITIAPGEDGYLGAIGNGVTSLSYGAWGTSFLFPDAPPGSGDFEVSLESWRFNLLSLDLEVGASADVVCAANGPLGAVWGSDPYTGDSSICTAAVHAGLFDLADGGTVTVEALAEQESFTGSEANGVTTQDYGPYGSAFTFVED